MRRGVTVLGLSLALAIPLAPGPASAAAGPATGRSAVQSAELATAAAQGVAARARATTLAANARISSVLATRTRSKVLGSKFTMTVWDAASGSYVYQRRSTASLRGASTTKILTAVGVLSALGPDHLFPTTVRAGATADEIVLVAGGDPLLSSANLRQLAASTVTALGGAVPTPAPVPSASATAVPSATPSTLPSTAPSAAVTAAAARSLAGRTIVVRADDSLFGDQSARSRGWKASYVPGEVRLVGAFARDDNKSRGTTKDAASYFVKALKALGVSATYAGEATAAPESATVATYAGHSVAQAVEHMLLISENDTAEMLFRQVAVGRGVPATWAGARSALAAALTDLGVPLTGVRIVDGSGLSLDGRLTAPALTTALSRALSADQPRLSGLRGWLPVAGRTGTLKSGYKRFSSKPSKCAAGLIQAKTGTVADAIALAGYANGADGQTKVFVSIVNSRPTRYSRLTTRQYVDRAASSVTGCW